MVCSTFIYFSYELQLCCCCCCVVYCPAHKFCCLYARTLCVPANTKWHFYVNQCARSPAHVCVAHKKKNKRKASKKNNLFDWKTIYLTRILLEYLMVFFSSSSSSISVHLARVFCELYTCIELNTLYLYLHCAWNSLME